MLKPNLPQQILIDVPTQTMTCFEQNKEVMQYSISTAKSGLGEIEGSECTPRGWHCVASIIGQSTPINTVFVGRTPTGEIYSKELGKANPNRDWILTRILWLEGLEEGFNKGGNLDSYNRYIYIHGTPDTNPMGVPLSHGCIRMRNTDIITLADWADEGVSVHIA